MEPKLRFKEFNGDWEETILNKVCKINPKTKEIPDFFNYIDLESVVDGRLLKENNLIDKKDAPSRAQRLLKNNDVLYQTVRPYQKNNYYFDISEKSIPYVASTGYAQLRASKNDPKFIFQEIHNDVFVNAVLEKCTGTSYPAINSSDLGKVRFTLPSLPEQTKIADFLSTVDEKIQNQQDKITHLENIKKGFMQKIFSRKIIFKDANGNEFPEWEERKLSRILKEGSKEKVDDTSQYRKITVKLNLKGINFSEIKRDMVDKRPFYIRYKDEIIIGKQNYFNGSIAIVDEIFDGCICSNAIMSFKVIRENLKFVYFYLSQSSYIAKNAYLANGTGQKELTEKDFLNMKIELPCLEEQQKIADFLSSFDEKIDVEKETLEHLKELKKGLLQQMFV
ncbi:MAG: restriction endonuclease subunit S [Clostridium sp.]|nr:restriction endonuclease subunit S [Clostridium sp.]